MTLAPLMTSSPLVQIHAAAALTAFGLGLWQLVGRKGTLSHRTLGWIWSGLMLAVALTSFGITGNRPAGSFSWVHTQSLVVLILLPLALAHARRGRIDRHRRVMLSLFLGALVIAGGFTLMPGRIMNEVVFGG